MYGALLIVAIIVIIALSVSVYQKTTNAICLSRRRLEGKTVIVTGGTAGMGLVIATDLAHRGARTIIACPFEEEGTNARKQIIQETGNQNVVFKLLDLASLQSVRGFASDILKTEDRLDILLNNAGVGIPGDFLTKDGMNFIMQVNYYGTFLLTLLLLPLLKKTGKPGEASRIITTASFLHMVGFVDVNNIYKANHYWSKIHIYGNSKICLVLFANELTKRLKGSNVVINNVDPGAVGTRIFDSTNIVFAPILRLLCLMFYKNPWQGAQTALHAALDTKAGEVSGQYFKNCEINRAVSRAYCDKIAKALWEESVRLVKLTDEEVEQCFKSL
ncbi:dehydrogenase/reductase SDR family member 13-like [Helicoverpa zea]|uniref:dehydrogenase/reductase SDR family member 13-like n=1 Tax=Helicoverpa zea TaxID=7113 RepID=UPI001F55DB3E|nr:dehydrogenase/reductase SDR family member 13-like [Helicoverpa zea]